MAFNFWKFLFGLHRKSDEGPNEKKNNKTYLRLVQTCCFPRAQPRNLNPMELCELPRGTVVGT